MPPPEIMIPAGFSLAVAFSRLLQGGLFLQRNECIENPVQLADARKTQLRQFLG